MKKILLVFMLIICTFTFAENTTDTNEVSIRPTISTPEILKKEVTSGVSTIELFTLKNTLDKKIKYSTSYDLFYVDENGKSSEIQPVKKTTSFKLTPMIGIGIIFGGGSASTNSGIGVDVSPNKTEKENGLKIINRFELKAFEEKTVSVGIDFKDLQLKDNPSIKINKGKITGTIYFNDRDGKVESLKIPIDIDLK